MHKKTDVNILGTSGTLGQLPKLPPPKEFREHVWELNNKVKFSGMSDLLHALPDILWEIYELGYKILIDCDDQGGGYLVQVFEEIRYSKGDPKTKHLLTLYNDISIPTIKVSYGTMKSSDAKGETSC